MAKKGTRHVLLTEPDGRLFGLVGQADLLGLKAGGAETLVEAIAAARDLDAMLVAADGCAAAGPSSSIPGWRWRPCASGCQGSTT